MRFVLPGGAVWGHENTVRAVYCVSSIHFPFPTWFTSSCPIELWARGREGTPRTGRLSHRQTHSHSLLHLKTPEGNPGWQRHLNPLLLQFGTVALAQFTMCVSVKNSSVLYYSYLNIKYKHKCRLIANPKCRKSTVYKRLSINIAGQSRNCQPSVGFTLSVGFPWKCLLRTHHLARSIVKWAASWRRRWIYCSLDVCRGTNTGKDRKVRASVWVHTPHGLTISGNSFEDLFFKTVLQWWHIFHLYYTRQETQHIWLVRRLSSSHYNDKKMRCVRICLISSAGNWLMITLYVGFVVINRAFLQVVISWVIIKWGQKTQGCSYFDNHKVWFSFSPIEVRCLTYPDLRTNTCNTLLLL